MDAELLIRAGLLSGVLFQEQAPKLREITIAYDQDHPPGASQRAEWEAKRKLLEAESVRYSQERDAEAIGRAQRELEYFREDVSGLLATMIGKLRDFAIENDLKLEDE